MMSPFYRRSVTGGLQTGKFLMNEPGAALGSGIAETEEKMVEKEKTWTSR